jgi:hypothetical protein
MSIPSEWCGTGRAPFRFVLVGYFLSFRSSKGAE